MSISKALEKLGFDPINDFILQDDGDGVYIINKLTGVFK